ncbi:MAG: RAMP superfamily CRISPR-associated protein, partial [Clostridiales bacterium]|nr:RAMP superfamily CRISPR-associated protein [Clostridiales bacterium]
MQNWRESSNGQKFVNPYNFVALGGPVPRTNLEKPPEVGEENITGAIHCRLRTVTPLAIPDEETKVEVKPESGHFKYLIFKIGGMPVITGSELRGMIRSVYETVTNSCLSVVNTNILSARHSFPRMPGLIKYNEKTQEWELYKAQKFMINNEVPTETEYSRKEMGQYYEIKRYGVEKWEIASPSVRGKKYVTGSEISFVPGANFETSKDYTLQTRVVSRVVEPDDTLKSGESKKDGYLLLWECLPERPQHSSQEKHHNSIFTLSDPEELVECVNIDQAVIGFRELIKIYEEDDYRPKSKTQYERVSYDLAMDGRFMPVWYETAINSQNETFVYLSPACISRTVFDNRLETLLGDHSTKNCVYNESEYTLCPACELFGRIGGDKDQKALGGSLRFTDAFREKSEQSLGFKRLRVLSGPKPEAVEMYTKRPQGATTWTYDYKTTGYETRKVTVETTASGTTVTTIKGGETV